MYSYYSDESLNTKTIFKYDKNDYKIGKYTYNSNGDLIWKIIFKNDVRGNPIEILQYDNGILYEKTLKNMITEKM